MNSRYLKSMCKGGYLHKFIKVRSTDVGILEKCERCGLTKHFPMNIPNLRYLEYHIRSVLRKNDKMFSREYPNL